MTIILRHQSFEAVIETAIDDRVITEYSKRLQVFKREKEQGKTVWKVKDKYFMHNIEGNSYIFAKGELEKFIVYIYNQGYSHNKPSIVNDKPKTNTTNNIKYLAPFKPKDEQAMFIDAMKGDSKTQYLVEARTGFGKTFMTAQVIADIKARVMFYIRPTYIDKWVSDIKKYFDVSDDDIFTIAGGDSLKELMNMKKIPSFVIASNVTMGDYIKNYYNGLLDSFTIAPDKLLYHLGIPLLVSDESHQFFANLYKSVIALNPEKFIGLSATLLTKDKKLESMYYSLFPEDTRLGLKFYKKFTHFVFYSYRFNYISDKAGQGPFGYSHNKFEEHILRDKRVIHNYLLMIKERVEEFYIKDKQDGDKLLIYAKSLNMIEKIKEYLLKEYPDLDIQKYIRGSPYEHAIESDIRISHPDKSGAALDIPGLVTVINTINIDSPSQLLQMSGRLREIKTRRVTFIQLYSTNIPKHKIYILSNLKYTETVAESIEWRENINTI